MVLKFDRYKLGNFPTPIEFLKNISNHLNGPQIFIKRDDCTGLATGGNKTRKLEYIMPDAVKNNASLVITLGAVQSNHARQTAAACAILNLKCLIILEQRLENAPDVYFTSSNVFLNKLFGAEIKVCPKNENIDNFVNKIMEIKKNEGESPYFIPVGGTNEIGELGYIECIREIVQEQKEQTFTHIVLASGSGGTHSGSIVGKIFYKSKINIIGISVKDNKNIQEEKIFNLAKKGCKYIRCPFPKREDVVVFDDFVGKGYGVPTNGMKHAIKLMAQKEAILLDPVYSGKAFDGLINLIDKKYFKDTDKILFIHTGGAVSLHAYEWAFE
ncbi:MAG: L-cysteate sulfo-lyase [Alphaproteobacteria bacterium MarineAlpha5_Bin9]|nr:MAG: L-cysteate sulfo-lyase [Alphaproteobacteria bacterium MarineAlpha5_Bin9]